ncbi:MAG: hypothetical protein S4CHLAM2_02410 [Chlamydiales bacterium]|nr:hypothetical protein [Chlamydiales bacterium]
MNKAIQYSFSLGYCFFTAYASVLIDGIDRLPVQLSLFVTSLIALLYFHIVNAKNIALIYKKLFKEPLLFFKVNLTAFLVWLSAYIGIQQSDASFFIFVFFMVMGVSAAWRGRHKLYILLMLICILAAIVIEPQFYIGFILAVFCGICGYFYHAYAHQVTEKTRIAASQLLAVRFYVLLITLLFFLPRNSLALISVNDWGTLLIISLSSFIIPLYLAQKGLMRLGVRRHTAILSSVPFITFLIEGVLLREWNWPVFILSILGPILLYLNNRKLIKLE